MIINEENELMFHSILASAGAEFRGDLADIPAWYGYCVINFGAMPRLCRVSWDSYNWETRNRAPEVTDPLRNAPGFYVYRLPGSGPVYAYYLTIEILGDDAIAKLRRKLEDKIRKDETALARCLNA